jgi:hypothetical protein|tara:strand:- start:587 stop:1204 length:618 start_codon:yes stop_codon:yes gene_type:complete
MILTKRIIVCVYLITSTIGCSTIGQGLKQGWEDFWGSGYVSIPSPRPGLVLPINRSPAVWAECWLFEGSFRQEELIIPHRTVRGKLSFAKTPLKHFIINPPVTVPYSNGVMSTVITVPLLLSPYPANYTLLVFHKNFRQWVVKMETRQFSTTGNPFNEYHISGGRKIYADKIIRLAKSKPYKRRQFRFHRTFYPGEALKSLLGLE